MKSYVFLHHNALIFISPYAIYRLKICHCYLMNYLLEKGLHFNSIQFIFIELLKEVTQQCLTTYCYVQFSVDYQRYINKTTPLQLKAECRGPCALKHRKI